MLLAPYFKEKNGSISVSREQGSDFAKLIASDFNPLHDADAKRFVVPGDLLFSLSLNKLGISQKMRFEFVGMVSADSVLSFDVQTDTVDLVCEDKVATKIQRSGNVLADETLIELISLEYVKFSGETFSGILLPLMKQENVMINPVRPMVMYQSMEIELFETNFSTPSVELANQEINVDGKRGDVSIHFNIMSDGKAVGKGEKNFLLSGLRAYDASAMEELVLNYEATKKDYMQAR